MRYPQIFALVAGLLAAAATSEARQPARPERPVTLSAPQRAQPPGSPQPPAPGFSVLENRDARETRNRLNEVLEQYPPSVREVLRIDPTLMYRADYLATYPVLAAFLEQHPEVAHNPSFFVGEYQFRERTSTPNMEAVRALRDIFSFAGVALIVMTITTGVILLVKTAVEHRRWQRALRSQTELHTKLIDRFPSSEELLVYLQSPAGKFLTDAPSLPQTAAPRAMSAPLNRIFWSIQAGIVIGALGAGLIYVSRNAPIPEVYQLLNGMGIVVLTIGIGFTASAAVSFLLSQRLGLVQLPPRYSGETPGS